MADASLRIVLVDEGSTATAGAATATPPLPPVTTTGTPSGPQRQPTTGPAPATTPSTRDAAITFAETLAQHAGFSRFIYSARQIAEAVGQFRTLNTALAGGASVAGPAATAARGAAGAAAGAAGAGASGAAASTATTAGATSGGAAAGGAGAAALAVVTGPVGITIAALGVAALGAGLALKGFANIVRDQARSLEGYSAAISMAISETDIRRERAMFSRAERIGPDVAKWERLRGEAAERLAEIGTEILDLMFRVVEPLEPIAREILEASKLIPPGIEIMAVNLETIKDVMTGHWIEVFTEDIAAARAAQDKLLKAIKDYIDRKDADDPVVDPFLLEFFEIGAERRRADARGGAP